MTDDPKHPRAIRWFHWINFPILALMIWSGLLIYWANPVYRIGFGERTLFGFFPDWFFNFFNLPQRLSEGMSYHFFLMWFFAINGFAYVIYTAISGEWRELVPNRGTLKHAWQTFLHDLHLTKIAPSQQKFNGAQQIAYTSVVLMGLGSLITGLAIYKPITFSTLTWFCGGYETARFIHFWLTIGYVLFFIIHVVQVIKAGWYNFRAMVTGYEKS
jgi:thiosulfate reductase cytochrome b subunit